MKCLHENSSRYMVVAWPEKVVFHEDMPCVRDGNPLQQATEPRRERSKHLVKRLVARYAARPIAPAHCLNSVVAAENP